jgi:hypothetical protein
MPSAVERVIAALERVIAAGPPIIVVRARKVRNSFARQYYFHSKARRTGAKAVRTARAEKRQRREICVYTMVYGRFRPPGKAFTDET